MRIHRMNFLALCIAAVMCTAATSAYAQDGENRFSVHGYLTQAYVKSDGLPINGIPKAGTTDYRVAALQIRYLADESDQFVLQIRNRRLGISPLNEDAMTLDWAYYSHDFGPIIMKAGRTPIPLGLYNEIRTVGTILPFYRAPATYYLEGLETIDGLVLSNRLPLGAWSLTSTVYGGGYRTKVPIQTPGGPVLFNEYSTNAYGAQLWLNTPLRGLRVGGSVISFPLPLGLDTTRNVRFDGSLDWTAERWFVRGEYAKVRLKHLINGADQVRENAYGQGGVALTERLWLNAQLEAINLNDGGYPYRGMEDQAIGIRYAFRPTVVFKVEAHTAQGYTYDVYVAPTGPSRTTRYGIASLSMSF